VTTGTTWQERLTSLLTAPNGAVMTVTAVESGEVLFRYPVAREWLLNNEPDTSDYQQTILVRPLITSTPDPTAFDTETARARSVTITAPAVDGATVQFTQPGDQELVTFSPADVDAAWIIDRWDDWLTNLNSTDPDWVTQIRSLRG
jgi:hypothetical protein